MKVLTAVPGGAPADARKRPPSISYVGFRTTGEGREYSLQARDDERERLFVVLVTQEDFTAQRVRFQDAPDLCFARLQRELAADPNLVPGLRLVVTAEELRDYRMAHQKHPADPRRWGTDGARVRKPQEPQEPQGPQG